MKRVYPVTIQSGMSQSGSCILMLCEPDSNLQMPIIIGQHEAQCILLAKETVKTRRPMTHELMKTLMETYGLVLRQVTIDRVEDGIFYANLHVNDGFSIGVGTSGDDKVFDSRATDAITLALLFDAPIFVADNVLDETAVSVQPSATGTQMPDAGKSVAELEEELRRCEENEEYERAAEIQAEIERRKP